MVRVTSLNTTAWSRGGRWVARSLLLLTVLLIGVGAVPVVAQNCNNYTVTFLGATFDDTNTTFRYRVCSSGSPAISHWVLGLPQTCATCADVVAAGRVGASSVNWSCGTDPTTGLFGVKFDFSYVGQCEEFWITLRGYWPSGYTTAAVKAGPGKCYYQVQGPVCPPPGQPGLVLEKKTNGVDADSPTGPVVAVGSTVTWTYEVTNTGNVTLADIVVTDDVLGPIGTILTLAPGASATFTKTGTAVTGQYANTGTAHTTYNGKAVSATDPSHYFGAAPSIQVVKTGALNSGGNGRADAGDTISYTFAVTNTGNVTLTNVTVTDPTVAVSGGPIASLAPGVTDSTTFTGTYVLTQADLDRGTFTNTATATGSYNGTPVTDSDDDTQTLVAEPALALVKTAAPTTYNAVGQEITYTFTVTNTGNVTLSGVKIDDARLGVANLGVTPSTLAPGEQGTAHATYTITQGDLDAGSVYNVATATATPPTGPTVTAMDDETIAALPAPGLALEKKTNGVDADSPTGPVVAVGSTVTWTYEVTNTGNVTLADIVVTDDVLGPIGTILTLAPGASATFTKTGTAVTGQYANTGTAHTTYNGEAVSATDPSHYVGVDGYIAITPGNATNEVGTPHTFLITAHAQGMAPNAWNLTYTVAPTPGSASLSGPTVAADGMSATWNLTIHHPTPAVFTASAAVTMTFPSGTQVTRTTDGISPNSGPATKTYLNARITISPLTATNEVGDPHTLVALVETTTDGITWSPARDVGVTFSIVGGAATFVGGGNTSITNGVGQATVQILSLTPGTVLVQAAADVSGDGTFIRTTGTAGNGSNAEKTYIDARISVTPLEAVNPLGTNHTVTAVVEVNTGTGWVPALDGTPVSFAFLTNTAGATFVTAPSTATFGGQASVTVFANSPGRVIIRATAEVTVNGVPLLRETGSGGPNGADAIKNWVHNNEPPTAESLSLVTCQNTPLTFALRGSDPDLTPVDAASHPLTFAIGGAPTHGALSGNLAAVTYRAPHEAALNVVYTPQVDFLGTDYITYTVTDPRGAFAVGRVQITVLDCGEEVAGGAGALGPRIVINEVAWGGTEADPLHEWVELYSSFDEPLDLTGWTLRWRRKQPATVLEQYVKVVELRGTIDPDGFYLMERRTNDVVRDIKADLIYDDVGPIVISEIAWGGTPASKNDQWIELINVTEAPIDLTGWILRWRLVQPITAADREWKLIELQGLIGAYSTYLLERGSDEVVRDIPADLIYHVALDPRGEVLEILDPTGQVVDRANGYRIEQMGWAAGYVLGNAHPHASMERVNPFAPDTERNWHANEGTLTRGIDRNGNPIVGTPGAVNEQFLLWAYPGDPARLPYPLTHLPFTLDLSDLGEVLELVDPAGNVVDTANADRPDRDGWAAGYGLYRARPFATMERVAPSLPDLEEHWHANQYIVINGVDAREACLVATARTTNEPVVIGSALGQAREVLRRGELLTIAVVVPALCNEIPCLPHAVLTKVDEVAGGGGAVLPLAGGEQMLVGKRLGRTDNFLFELPTAELEPGVYRLWISLGEGLLRVLSFEVMANPSGQ